MKNNAPKATITKKTTGTYKAVVSEMVRAKIERAERSQKALISEIESITKGKPINVSFKDENLILY